MATVLVVDDDADLRKALADSLGAKGHAVRTAALGREALDAVAGGTLEVVLLDLHLEDMDGLDILDKVREIDPELPVIILTGDTGIPTAVKAMKRGAVDYLTKPCRNEEIGLVVEKALRERALEREVEVLRQRITRGVPAEEVIGTGPAMGRVMEEAGRIAPTDLTVILQGESGTGKELVARRIHHLSSRRSEDFVAVDCGALPDSLVESELFGHEKGAFTGAHQRKLGQFELALGGTLFLDEIVNLPYATQAKLLRAIQERRIRRVGGRKDIPTDARIVVASNVDLLEAVRQGRFREDLYHRLDQFCITLPPLRDRPEDVDSLAAHFVAEANRTLKKRVRAVSPAALGLLRAHRWPGNVRELKNVVTRAVLLADDWIEPQHLALHEGGPGPGVAVPPGPSASPSPVGPKRQSAPPPRRKISFKRAASLATASAEKRLILEALKKSEGNKARTAKSLRITRMTLYLKLKKYGIPL